MLVVLPTIIVICSFFELKHNEDLNNLEPWKNFLCKNHDTKNISSYLVINQLLDIHLVSLEGHVIDCHAIENYKLQKLTHSKKNTHTHTRFTIVTLKFFIVIQKQSQNLVFEWNISCKLKFGGKVLHITLTRAKT
jgi:hypothetical protein